MNYLHSWFIFIPFDVFCVMADLFCDTGILCSCESLWESDFSQWITAFFL